MWQLEYPSHGGRHGETATDTSLGNFNYGSLQSMMVFFSVPASVVRPLLAGTGLEPGIFDGKALVNLNFERYAGFGSNYSSFVDEVEFNAVVFPKDKAGQEPRSRWRNT